MFPASKHLFMNLDAPREKKTYFVCIYIQYVQKYWFCKISHHSAETANICKRHRGKPLLLNNNKISILKGNYEQQADQVEYPNIFTSKQLYKA